MPKRLTRRQQAFLEAYRVWGFIKIAADKASVSRELHYNALRVSETYRDTFSAIEKEHTDALVQQAQELSLQGPIAPVYYSRKIVGFRLNPSIRLLMKQLRLADPKKFSFRKPRPRKPDSGRDFPGFSLQAFRRADSPGSRPKPDSEGVFRLSRLRSSRRVKARKSEPSKEIRREDGPALQASEQMRRFATRPAGPGWATGWPFRPEGSRGPGGKPDSEDNFRRRAGVLPQWRTQQHLHGSLDRSASGEGRGEPLHPHRSRGVTDARNAGVPPPKSPTKRAWASQPP